MMNYCAQRGAYCKRGNLAGVVGIIGMLTFLSVPGNHWFWMWLLIGLPLFFWVIRPMFGGNPMNQPQFSVQPGFQQQEQPEDPSGQHEHVSHLYKRGYAAPPAVSQRYEAYREGSQSSQYQARQQGQQYEEPLTMYPQE
ncbi:MAG TPA: hypothetical protein VFN35_32490 [Ktedonobacteraceae bacterium]|nr:hypothetical protein [Ktedonobacteraceae bacterium]